MQISGLPAWNFKRIYRHIAYWCFWLLLFSTVNSSYGSGSFWKWLHIELIMMSVKLPFTYFMIYFLVPRFLLHKKYVQFILFALLATLAGGTIIYSIYYFFLPGITEFTHSIRFFGAGFFYKTIDLVYVSSFPIIYKMNQHYLRQEKQTREISEQKLQAEIELLKHQLHPHFLFNTLNNLYGIILTGQEHAADIVLRLSHMMRYMLYECNSPYILLENEITQLQNYITLEKLRYGKRLSISFEVSGDYPDKLIPPLLLIGFVENACKHGAGEHIAASWIRINIWVSDNTLDFMVENNLKEKEKENDISTHSGIGLTNIKKRLDLMYPGRHQLKIESKDTYLINLRLKF